MSESETPAPEAGTAPDAPAAPAAAPDAPAAPVAAPVAAQEAEAGTLATATATAAEAAAGAGADLPPITSALEGGKSKNDFGISHDLSLGLGLLSFLLFSIIKCVEVGKSHMETKFDNWMSVWLNSSVIIYKIFSSAVMYLFFIFLATSLLLLFAVLLLTQMMNVDRPGSFAGLSAMGVLKNTSKIFLGYLSLENVIVCNILIAPFFFSLFILFFAITMWKPEQSKEEDSEPGAVETTMKHYVMMFALMVYFLSVIFVYVKFKMGSKK